MRFIVFTAFVLISLISAASFATQPLSDAQIEKLVVGKWQHEKSETGAQTEYREDGSFAGTGSIERIEGIVRLSVSGRWKVIGGEMIEVIEKCAPPGITAGTTHYGAVLELNASTFRYRTEQGIERTMTRIND